MGFLYQVYEKKGYALCGSHKLPWNNDFVPSSMISVPVFPLQWMETAGSKLSWHQKVWSWDGRGFCSGRINCMFGCSVFIKIEKWKYHNRLYGLYVMIRFEEKRNSDGKNATLFTSSCTKESETGFTLQFKWVALLSGIPQARTNNNSRPHLYQMMWAY